MSSPIVWKDFPPSPFKKEVASENTQLKGGDVSEDITGDEPVVKNELMVIEQPTIAWEMPEPMEQKDEYYYIDIDREPMTTFCITPNNSPENKYGSSSFRERENFQSFQPRNKEQTTELILNTISGLFQKFYLPHHVRFRKNGLRIKLNDVVSYKIAIENGSVKFYMSVPKRWKKNFMTAIRQDWGQVDITEVDNKIIEFDLDKTQAMELRLRHHYALSLKHETSDSFKQNRPSATNDNFLSSITSLASTLGKDDKLLIDYNIEPVNHAWKEKANKILKEFKKGRPPTRETSFTVGGLFSKTMEVFMLIVGEFANMIEEAMGSENLNNKNMKESKENKQPFTLSYSEPKIHANSKGYKVQIRVLGQSDDARKIKHNFKNIETAYGTFDGDNKYVAVNIKPDKKKKIERMVRAVENNEPLMNGKPTDIYFEKELKDQIKLPSKETLIEYNKVIAQDAFTRTEVDEDFMKSENGAIPFATTLDKEPKTLYIPGYLRGPWTPEGRKAKVKMFIDDRSTAMMIFGGMGSGKTSFTENQIMYTFGAHIKDKERWKRESKSVVAFDVADGEMIKRIYSRIPDWMKDRVIVLNHGNFINPIAVNNADLNEFNSEVMKDDDYGATLAEMEARLVLEILQADKTIAMDRWFIAAMKCVHSVNKDWGYIEALRILVDDDFRNNNVIPFLKNRRLKKEMENYNVLAENGQTGKIVETVQNRFSQLESDPKLWDCIAQKPVRNEEGKVKLNFRQMMDGDENGAYLILIHIPKNGVTKLFRRFIFAHYFLKVWNVLLSREVGFAGREYRPETLIAVDEIHQIVDIPIIARLFVDLFKEPRKYSGRYLFTLHGWSSLAKAGRGLEGDIKDSIMDNGCNLVMLKGGEEAFKSLNNFLQPMELADFNNLMQMKYCGIFAIRSKNKNHVIQARMIPSIEHKNSDFEEYRKVESDFITKYNSPYGRNREEVRDDCFARSEILIDAGFASGTGTDKHNTSGNESSSRGEDKWSELEKDGMKDEKEEDE